ncbi:MAG: hypothetical protein ACLFVO_05120 [Chloroflexaceae bacterium]
MKPHPVDVVVLFPGFFEALTQVFEMLVEQGLEVYPQNGQWFWRWRTCRTEGHQAYASLGEAVAAALLFRLRTPYSSDDLPMN